MKKCCKQSRRRGTGSALSARSCHGFSSDCLYGVHDQAKWMKALCAILQGLKEEVRNTILSLRFQSNFGVPNIFIVGNGANARICMSSTESRLKTLLFGPEHETRNKTVLEAMMRVRGVVFCIRCLTCWFAVHGGDPGTLGRSRKGRSCLGCRQPHVKVPA